MNTSRDYFGDDLYVFTTRSTPIHKILQYVT